MAMDDTEPFTVADIVIDVTILRGRDVLEGVMQRLTKKTRIGNT